jgi:hypothetical protein
VLYAEDKTSNIDYTTGRINADYLKTAIVDILDGGEKNLKMRLHKYDFKYEEEM